MRIVVVEDEVIIREGIAKLLKKLSGDYELAGEAENGEEGLDLVCRERPDIVITDIRMVGMDGLEMLERIYEQGIPVKAIVISAYSEFEYARTAMKMGVTQYLLKPITLDAFSQALENVRHQIEQEAVRNADQFGSLEQIFENILSGVLEPEKDVREILEKKYAVSPVSPLAVFCAYLGSEYPILAKTRKRALESLCREAPIRTVAGQNREQSAPFVVLAEDYRKSLVAVFYNCESIEKPERWLQQASREKKPFMGFGFVQAEDIIQLRPGFEALLGYMDWNIALNDVVITWPGITGIQTVPCIYPYEMEKRIKALVCANDWNGVRRQAEEFQQYFQSGKVYEPKEIKECYVRFLWAVIAISKEIGCIDYRNLKQAQLLEQVMGTKTRAELSLATEQVLSRLKETNENGEIILHLTVKRATEMIHEYYQTGITLEEIASTLNVTPEYLGTQFHREMGINFGAYIRKCRMDKAKELLCRTNLKLYEIAEQVGYSNPKYFSQVFKEYTGQLPLAYRKTYT